MATTMVEIIMIMITIAMVMMLEALLHIRRNDDALDQMTEQQVYHVDYCVAFRQSILSK